MLDNYNLSKCQLLQSLFVSEYGLRHWAASQKKTTHKLGHRIIAVIELCPLLGLIATIIERLLSSFWSRTSSLPPHSEPSSPPASLPQIQRREWVFQGGQSGCNGDITREQAQKIIQELNEKSRERGIANVSFQETRLGDSVEGGTCTAMTLQFIEEYNKIRQALGERRTLAQVQASVAAISSHFLRSSKPVRTLQAAYNTITVTSPVGEDPSRAKIAALVSCLSLGITYTSKEIDTEKVQRPEEISSEIEQLPEGVFLLRILRPADNHKLEVQGHSLVYIREHDFDLLYDPNWSCCINAL